MKRRTGIYIHIPFCIKKCNYCDFLSFENCSSEEWSVYTKALYGELAHLGKVYGNDIIVDTIFLGGGTPSVLDSGLVTGILTVARDSFKVEKGAEITIEANPGTLTDEKLHAYLESGVNRLSLGVQSLCDEVLARLGRIHDAAVFYENYELARRAGFSNINLDLMFAVPGHEIATWEETLSRAISLGPEHISAYSLQLEEDTPFFAMFERGEIHQVSDDLDREMYHRAIKILCASGYNHYEISNFAKPGYECRHNLKYWSMDDYLGAGLSAHSFIDGKRFANTMDVKAYLVWGTGEKPEPELYEACTEQDLISEYLFTGMRKIKGIDLSDFESRFGKSLSGIYGKGMIGILKGYEKEGCLELKGNWMRFTEKGIDISNRILAEFV